MCYVFCYLLVVSLFFVGVGIAQCQVDAGLERWKIPAQAHKFHVSVLMVQSNMSRFRGLVPVEGTQLPSVVKLPTVDTGELDWLPASHPLQHRLSSDQTALGLPFASECFKSGANLVVGLIPVALGGASIDKFKRRGPMHEDGREKAKFAMQRAELKGVLWHQGELDMGNDVRANSCRQGVHHLIADLRTDVADAALRFIAGKLAESSGTAKDHRHPDRTTRINNVCAIPGEVPDHFANTGVFEP